ncbi:MAG: type II secretion system F family protein [Candidatus Nanopelagicales bacterium]
MNARLLPRIAAGSLGVLVLFGGTAWAEPSATIEQIDAKNNDVRVVVSLTDTPSDAEVDTSNVQLSIDGVQLETTTQSVADSSGVDQLAVLVLDTSGSMAGARIVAAKQAAQEFLAAVPDEVEVGLVTFSNNARVAVAPTTNRSAVSEAISGLQASGSTALYDAVVLAARQLAPADIGAAIVLSDGANEGGDSTLRQAERAAKRSDGAFDAISFGSDRSQVQALKTITGATGGSVTNAKDAAELSAAFQQSAEAISNQYIVTGAIPDDFSSLSATITVTVPVGDVALTDAAFVQLADIQRPDTSVNSEPIPVGKPGFLADIADQGIWLALAGLFIALLVLIFFAISSTTDRDSAGGGVRRRLSIYTLGSGQPVKEQETTVLGDTQVARSAVEFAGKVVAQRDMESIVGSRLEAAAVPLKPAEWLLIHVGVTIASGLLFLLVFGGRIVPTLLGLTLGFIVPWIYLSIKESRRTKAFMASLPDTLQLIAGSLSAGYSMPQAVDTVVREGSPPISTEFNRALVETRLGVPLEDALDGIADRMRSVDFAWVVMAIRIQREVGGNLAEVLTTVAATLRERERLRRQVQVLSAEGKLSAWILGLLPVVFTIYLVIAQPDYLSPLVTRAIGWVLVAAAIILMIVGAVWMRKVVQVEV